MIRVFLWLPKGDNVGHTSLEIEEADNPLTEYISWWPSASLNQLKKAPGTTQSLADDIRCEGRPPDVSIELEELESRQGLDENAIRRWWRTFQAQNLEYGLGGKNCSWVVVSALQVGGSDKFFPWYKINVKKNIPMKTVLIPLIVPLLRFVTIQDIPIMPAALRVFNTYVKSFTKQVKGGRSMKLAAVAAVDEFSSIWSPQDALAFCIVLKENLDRTKAGATLLGT
jgi:hypothetical protein